MKRIVLIILFLSLTTPVFAASKESQVRKGNALYKKGKYDAALKHFESALKKDSESPIINFNTGAAYYQIQDYDNAISHLQKALLADDKNLKKNAHYNLGNALYAKAKALEDTDPVQAFAYAQKSKEQFESALKLDDKDKDALYNYEAAKKKEEEIAKKLPKKKSPLGKDGEKTDTPGKEDEKSKKWHEKEDAKNSVEDKNAQQQQDSDQGEKKEEQNSEQGFSQKIDEENKSEQKSEQQQAQAQLKPGEMSKEEAKALLQQFDQSDEATGLLNLDKKKTAESPVLKDW